ncbi:MAG: J domain-containing protein [Nitrospinota bacterium]
MRYPAVLKSYNLYHLLGVKTYASKEEIKTGYRKLALKYHPDRDMATEEEEQKFVLTTVAYNFLSDDKRRQAYERILRKKEEKHIKFKSEELVCQRQKTYKRFYSARLAVDHDFNRFVDECRANFAKFLKFGSKIKARPKVISKMNTNDFEGYVEDGLNGFQDFLKSVPRIQKRRFRNYS